MALAFIEFKRRLRWADADAAARLHFPRIFEIIEDKTTTVIVPSIANSSPASKT